ncbi:geranylgeranyl transferase type beta subunit [Anaeramoeba ignava]|uniref:Geranylgeranyl transferase type beta subunit n=1 Tax=Anaeramoeba ignava TaxID=1746090 RepID=A0A9Q0LK76_ANAIG|nr:geranylgeranyl transferase type beta subunit [Anaeramoeba ignava]|eukprot:Anaeramoba_ignava/a480153_349.p1 GENE.a480153_349~~a480153_349.p1  ORF type:complete len:1001 (+),score=325.45 a480153_349:77-3079(+)
MKFTVLSFLFLFSFFLFVGTEKTTQTISLLHEQIISNLDKFQNPYNGGFSWQYSDAPNIQATSGALLLSSLYGLRDLINISLAEQFIHGLKNKDYGYSFHAGIPSDVQAVFYALWSYQLLGTASIPENQQISNFFQSIYDRDLKMFSNQIGGRGDIVSTYYVFKSLEFMKDNSAGYIQESKNFLKQFLKTSIQKNPKGEFLFNFPNSKNLIESNYYGLYLASTLGLQINDTDQWASFIVSHQCTETEEDIGGFYESPKKLETSLQNTIFAIDSLKILSEMNKNKDTNYMNLIDKKNAMKYLIESSKDLESVALAHYGIVVMGELSQFLETSLECKPLQEHISARENFIIEGTDCAINLEITTFNEKPHTGFKIQAETQISEQRTQTYDLLYKQEYGKYISDSLVSTKGRFGKLGIKATATSYFPGIGSIQFQTSREYSVGFEMIVTPQAMYIGNVIQPNEVVAIGTEFGFEVQLNTLTQHGIRQGDFSVSLSVLDSSNTMLYFQKINSELMASEGLHFNYKLDDTHGAIAPGNIFFRFEVGNPEKGIFTQEEIIYKFDNLPIATELNFADEKENSNHKYKFKETIEVSMIPAMLSPQRKISYFSYENQEKEKDQEYILPDNTKFENNQRNFHLLLTTETGSVVKRIKATKTSSVDDKLQLTFRFKIPPQMNFIGKNFLTFQYVAADSTPSELVQYNILAQDELDQKLSFDVDAKLQMVEIKKSPNFTEDFRFGNTVHFKFQLKDLISGQIIKEDRDVYPQMIRENNGVFMEIRKKNFDINNEFSTAVVGSVVNFAHYFIFDWTITSNTIRGECELRILWRTIDEVPMEIYKIDDEQSPVLYDIEIGGLIEAQPTSYSTKTKNFLKTIFVLSFELSCQTENLNNARLYASILYQGKNKHEPFSIAEDIAISVSQENNSYQLTYSLDHEEAKTGIYTFNIYRIIDRLTSNPEELTPFVSFEVSHTQARETSVLVGGQFLSVLIFGGVFLWIGLKRYYMEKMV